MDQVAPLVRIRDLAYSYPGGPEILRIPALDVSGRGLIAITGPSGAGKSTFVELLAGTLQSGYQGSVEVLGSEWRDLRRDADRQRHLRRIGFIPQDFGLLPDRTPRQMLQQDLTDSGVPTDEHAERIDRALAEVEIVDLADQRIASLSGGQGQRVAIARMLARNVDLVIADEPTANLDPGLRSVVMGLLRKLSVHVPVIVVTHDAAVAEACDRTIILQPAASRVNENLPKSLPRKRRPRVVFVVVIVLLLIVGASGAVLAIARGSSNKAGGTVGLRIITISASQSSPRYQVRIPYPQLVSSESNPALTRIDVVLADAAQAPVAGFEQALYSSTSATLPEEANETSMLTGTAATDVLDSQFASFSLNISQFNAGAAHPFASLATFNFDEKTGSLIQLGDLFQPGSDWLSVLSQESRSLLPAVIGQNSLPDEFGSGTGPSASNFKAWALTPWGLSIAFQEYQVGPYADGQPTILIPFSALQSVALARGPLASIEASRPLRSPLLPAVVPPAVNECMAPTSWGPAGPTPLRCASGALNVSAWNEWNIGGNYSVTGLGRSAALKTVEKAMCADVKFDPSYSAPFEIRLATLSALYYGWRFAANPASNFPRYCTTIASKTSSSKTSSTTTTTSNAFADVVPVVECPSVYGIAATPASKYPSTIAVSLPASVAEQLSYYSDSTRSVLPILAPRGWDCSVGVGADGQVGIGVFPQSPPASFPSSFEHSSVQGVIAHSDSACQGCISETACPLVPSAVEGTFSTYSPCPYSRPPNEEVRWALGSPSTPLGLYTYDVVYFTDPPGVAGDGAPSGGPLTARGVLLFSNGPDTYPAASIETCTLPSNLAGLCTPILNDFSNREWYVSG